MIPDFRRRKTRKSAAEMSYKRNSERLNESLNERNVRNEKSELEWKIKKKRLLVSVQRYREN